MSSCCQKPVVKVKCPFNYLEIIVKCDVNVLNEFISTELGDYYEVNFIGFKSNDQIVKPK
jgi:hypothetical protein